MEGTKGVLQSGRLFGGGIISRAEEPPCATEARRGITSRPQSSARRCAHDVTRGLVRERKLSSGHEPGVRTDRNGPDCSGKRTLRRLRRIESSISIQPRQATARPTRDRAEIASHKDLPVRLHRQGENAAVDPGIGRATKALIDFAARTKASQIPDLPLTCLGEGASSHNVAAGQKDQRVHLTVHSLWLGEIAIQRPIGVQSRNVVAGDSIDRAEPTAYHDLPIRLDHHCEHLAIHTFAGAKSRRKRHLVLRPCANDHRQYQEEAFHGTNPFLKSAKIKL